MANQCDIIMTACNITIVLCTKVMESVVSEILIHCGTIDGDS